MVSRRTVLGLLASASAVATTSVALAKQEHHKNGHALLGAKLKQNGKHEVDRAGKATVTAEVNNGKIVAMNAAHPKKGNLPVRKLKSKKQMAWIDPGIIRASATGDTPMLAQDVYLYYAWCFDDGFDTYCYWYPADVVIVDASWIDYYGPV